MDRPSPRPHDAGPPCHRRPETAAAAAGFGTAAELEFREIALPVVNGAAEAATIADAAAALVGEAAVDRDRIPAMGSEDFSTTLAERPGAYVLVGNGTVDTGGGGCEAHNPRYDVNDAAIPYGAGVLAVVVEHEMPRTATG